MGSGGHRGACSRGAQVTGAEGIKVHGMAKWKEDRKGKAGGRPQGRTLTVAGEEGWPWKHSEGRVQSCQFPDYLLPQAVRWLGHWGWKPNVMVSSPEEESR